MQEINVESESVWARLGIKLTKHGWLYNPFKAA
jgi:hypothetical protein